MEKIYILEGIDGTGKTTFASQEIKKSTWKRPLNYIYFPKLSTPKETINYWYLMTEAIRKLRGGVIIDRSVISTFVYEPNLNKYDLIKILQDTLDPKKTVILYFTKIYKHEEGIDYDIILNRYGEYLTLIEKHFEVLYIK